MNDQPFDIDEAEREVNAWCDGVASARSALEIEAAGLQRKIQRLDVLLKRIDDTCPALVVGDALIAWGEAVRVSTSAPTKEKP